MTGTLDVQVPDIRVPRQVYGLMRVLAHGINRAYWRVSVDGERVPAQGGVILAPVHRSFIDFFVVSEATRRRVFFMTKEEMWHLRPLGAFLEATGAFPVQREGTDRRSLARAQGVLERGDVLVVFPEGTRRVGPEVSPLHAGAAFLASRTGAAIVPVGVGGTDRSLPKGAKLPRPVAVHLVVGRALAPPEHKGADRIPRHELHELTERLRKELQRVYDEARVRSRSAGDHA